MIVWKHISSSVSDTHTPLLHLHNRDDSFHTRLRTDCAEYFQQTDMRLTNREKTAVAEFLAYVEFGRSRWWYLLRAFLEWHNDYDIQLPLDSPMPNYRNITN